MLFTTYTRSLYFAYTFLRLDSKTCFSSDILTPNFILSKNYIQNSLNRCSEYELQLFNNRNLIDKIISEMINQSINENVTNKKDKDEESNMLIDMTDNSLTKMIS